MTNTGLVKSLMSILFLLPAISFGRSTSLSAEGVFEAYKNAMKQSSLHKNQVAYRAEGMQRERIPAKYKVPTEVIVSKWSVFRDGVRMHSRRVSNIFKNDELITENRMDEYLLDNKHCFAFNHDVPPFDVWAFARDREGVAFTNFNLVEGAFEGYLLGDTLKHFWDYLEETTITSKLREDTEVIDGYETYVLEIETANLGHFTLWIDYNRGYNLRRFVARRAGTDLVRGKPLNAPPPPPHRDIPLIRSLPTTELTTILDSVKIKNIGGIFVPVEGRVTITSIKSNGEKVTGENTYRRSDIDLNPDFDKYESAFVLGVPDGTRVRNTDLGSGVPYVWVNGKMVADVDDLVIAELDKTTQQIMADGDVPAKLGSFKKTATNNQESNAIVETDANVPESQPQVLAESHGMPVVALVLIGLAIVGVAGLLVFGKLKA